MAVIIDGTTGITTPGETNTGNLSVAGSTTLTTPLPVASGGTGATSLSSITVGTATNATNATNATTATTATTATNLAGGSNGTIPYQSASGTTQMLAVGTSGQYLKTNGVGAPSWATVSAGFTLGTPVTTTSGTTVTFTGIPAGTKQVIVNFSAFGLDDSQSVFITLGTSSGIETADYKSASGKQNGSGNTLSEASTAFVIRYNNSSNTLSGSATFTLQNSSTNTFVASGVFGNRDADSHTFTMGGTKSLSGVLDRIRITSLNGAANFNSGSINIAYI